MKRAALAAAPVAAAGAVVAVVAGGGAGSDAGARSATERSASARVQRTTLVDRQRVDGTLGYRDERSVVARVSGTVTWLAPEGSVVAHGRTLLKADGVGVYLFDGRLPAYRPLSTASSDGRDVRQLERGLQRLGYDPGTVDDDFTASTAAAVREWQDDHDLPRTGKVELGRIVFLPGKRRIADHDVKVGDVLGSGGASPQASLDGTGSPVAATAFAQGDGGTASPDSATPPSTTPTTPATTTPAKPETPSAPSSTTPGRTPPSKTPAAPAETSTPRTTGNNPSATGGSPASPSDDGDGAGSSPATEAMTTTSTRRVVSLDLGAADQAIAREGARVSVELPDGEVLAGRIARVGRVAKRADSTGNSAGDGDSGPTVTVTIRLTGGSKGGRLDEAPVSVELARARRKDVLAVPVTALVARRGGKYAVDVVGRGLVAVVPGLFADGLVEVEGDLREGQRVRVPAG